MAWIVETGDCRQVLAGEAENSVDACVCDPPYELGFMGKSWDSSGVAFDHKTWAAVLRVLKPGGHLIAFSGSRTSHRMVCAIEDAGFEIRDSLQWLYGTGFPKSLNVGKAIDKARNEDREAVLRVTAFLAAWRDYAGLTNAQIDDSFQTHGMAGHWTSAAQQPAVPQPEQWAKLKELLGFGAEMDAEVARLCARKGEPSDEYKGAPITGYLSNPSHGGVATDFFSGTNDPSLRERVKDAAKRWDGWGTALKPGFEPACLARKPLLGTVAQNVVRFGTGGLNIDGCVIPVAGGMPRRKSTGVVVSQNVAMSGANYAREQAEPAAGRWPVNVLLDEGAAEQLGEVSRFFYCAKASRAEREVGCGELPLKTNCDISGRSAAGAGLQSPRAGVGRLSAVRNGHPTVKPVSLMRWLVRLVTPPGGVVLDPFTGSGSTGVGATLEGFDFLGVEQSEEYAAIARARIGDAAKAKE